MKYKIRETENERQFCEQVTMDVIHQVISAESIGQVIQACGVTEQRVRCLPAWLTLVVCIGMNLLSEISLFSVLVRLVRGTRLLEDVGLERLATKSAISQARYRLGAKPLEMLFKRVCRPLATPDSLGAFAFGLRLVAMDGTTEDVPDTPLNAAYFGRHHGDRGDSAFPQVKGVYLAECGTHAIFDAVFYPCHTSEHRGARRLLRSVEPDMLVLVDRGLYSYELVVSVHQRGAQVVCRLSSSVKPRLICRLPDGSYWAYIYPDDYRRRRAGEHRLVRIIEYTFDDPHRPGYREVHRLLTTLLDPQRYPALDLVVLYHERWEVELVIDELDTHLRLLDRPLRSLVPVGVLQELYALLLAHFVVRSLMHQAALFHHLDPDQISFVQSVRLLCDALADFQLVHPSHHPRLWSRLLADIAFCRLPPRDRRINPRVVKRKMSKFKLKHPEHRRPPRPQPFRNGVVLLSGAARA
jgi:hypothetical protein